MILLTGFRPFLKQTINPSLLLAQRYCQENPSVANFLELPVEYTNAFSVLENYVDALNEFPQKLIMLGQAAGRTQVCLERVALNWIESIHADEAGVRSSPRKILATAPAAYIQEEWSWNLEKVGNEIKTSHSAGTYVCNELYFRVLHKYSQFRRDICFVHVPLLPEQALAGEASMEIEKQFELIKKVIEVVK